MLGTQIPKMEGYECVGFKRHYSSGVWYMKQVDNHVVDSLRERIDNGDCDE